MQPLPEQFRILGSLLAIITFVSSIDQFSLSVEKAILRGCLKSIPYSDTVSEQKKGLDAGMREPAETHPTNRYIYIYIYLYTYI